MDLECICEFRIRLDASGSSIPRVVQAPGGTYVAEVKFDAFDLLPTLPVDPDRPTVNPTGLCVSFTKGGGNVMVGGWPRNGSADGLEFFIGFLQAPPPNTNERVVDAVMIMVDEPRALAQLELSIDWR
ncbi:MAG: hypothetical protein OXH52_09000 [Gammaproteobacteria bacterium]|nr:hypothetical protein [Gammaproteobacteria bacterium]